MTCMRCGIRIPHDTGDMVIRIRAERGKFLKMAFCLQCANELILSRRGGAVSEER